MNVKPIVSPSTEEDFVPKVYWENRLSNNFSLGGVGHGLLEYQYNRWAYRLRDRVLRRHLARLDVRLSDAKILDVGSGTGFYIDFWRKVGAGFIFGSDLTQVSVQHLRERFPDQTFYQLDIGDVLSSDLSSPFDVVSAFDILFHIVDDALFDRAIHNISCLLRPGGLFVFSDLFLHGEREASSHIVRRPLARIERVLAESGFEIILRRPVFVVLMEPGDTQSMLPEFAWRLLTYPVRWSESVGWVLGALLYPIDLILTKVLRESPTTEMMICRKVR